MKVAGSHTQLMPLDVVRESILSEDRGVVRTGGPDGPHGAWLGLGHRTQASPTACPLSSTRRCWSPGLGCSSENGNHRSI